jgi:hypothetical protein
VQARRSYRRLGEASCAQGAHDAPAAKSRGKPPSFRSARAWFLAMQTASARLSLYDGDFCNSTVHRANRQLPFSFTNSN